MDYSYLDMESGDDLLSYEGAPTTIQPGNKELVNPNFANLVLLSQQYGEEGGVGGNVTWYKGNIPLSASVQDYDLKVWAKDQGIEKVKMIPDGNGEFTEGMDMLVNKEHLGFGKRSWRYSAFIDNGEVIKMFVEPGKNNTGSDQDPFEASYVDTMLKYLQDAK